MLSLIPLPVTFSRYTTFFQPFTAPTMLRGAAYVKNGVTNLEAACNYYLLLLRRLLMFYN